MKILMFENEFNYIETQFDYINAVHFNNQIEIDLKQRSQDLRDYNSINDYDYIFIDISLSKKSLLDGFGILKKIESIEGVNKSKIIILTGNHMIKQGLIEHGITHNYKILTKPIEFNDLLKIFNSQ